MSFFFGCISVDYGIKCERHLWIILWGVQEAKQLWNSLVSVTVLHELQDKIEILIQRYEVKCMHQAYVEKFYLIISFNSILFSEFLSVDQNIIHINF